MSRKRQFRWFELREAVRPADQRQRIARGRFGIEPRMNCWADSVPDVRCRCGDDERGHWAQNWRGHRPDAGPPGFADMQRLAGVRHGEQAVLGRRGLERAHSAPDHLAVARAVTKATDCLCDDQRGAGSGADLVRGAGDRQKLLTIRVICGQREDHRCDARVRTSPRRTNWRRCLPWTRPRVDCVAKLPRGAAVQTKSTGRAVPVANEPTRDRCDVEPTHFGVGAQRHRAILVVPPNAVHPASRARRRPLTSAEPLCRNIRPRVSCGGIHCGGDGSRLSKVRRDLPLFRTAAWP